MHVKTEDQIVYIYKSPSTITLKKFNSKIASWNIFFANLGSINSYD